MEKVLIALNVIVTLITVLSIMLISTQESRSLSSSLSSDILSLYYIKILLSFYMLINYVFLYSNHAITTNTNKKLPSSYYTKDTVTGILSSVVFFIESVVIICCNQIYVHIVIRYYTFVTILGLIEYW